MKKATDYIKQKTSIKPTIGVVLGSGLGIFVDSIQSATHIPYNEIPDFRKTKVKGHKGEFVIGEIEDKKIICANGRFHYYEGYPFDKVAIIIDIFKHLGCELVIMTNASGCVVEQWEIGDLMLINGHMDYSFIKSNDNPPIIKDSRYDSSLLSQVKDIGSKINIPLREGVYTWTTGPTYETPSEIKDIQELGGHAVGMSGLPEIERVHELKMKLIGLCCLTNYGSGMQTHSLTHKEVVEKAEQYQKQFLIMLESIIKNLSLN